MAAHTQLKRVLAQVPITALAFYRDSSGALLILAGEDTDICVYSSSYSAPSVDDTSQAKTWDLVCRFHVFDEQPVHGICVQQARLHIYPDEGREHENEESSAKEEKSRVLVWGASSVAVFTAEGIERGVIPKLTHTKASDWIYDGIFSPFDPSKGVLITAHNEIVRFHIPATNNSDDHTYSLDNPVSPARPILYSAALSWEEHDSDQDKNQKSNSVLVAAGTAFGEILFWRCRLTDDGKTPPTCEMLFVLTGHEGSIFGVDISPSLMVPTSSSDEKDGSQRRRPVRLLASCSDDRTVRIWDVTDENLGSGNGKGNGSIHTESNFSKARETGFGPSNDGESERAVEPVAMAMGHISRIWGVKFARRRAEAGLRDRQYFEETQPVDNDDEDGLVMGVYTFGEDSTTQKWKLDLSAALRQDRSKEPIPSKKNKNNIKKDSLVPDRLFALHDGKHIWSHATLLQGTDMLIATGGSDSKISLIQDSIFTSQNFNNPSTFNPYARPILDYEIMLFDAQDIVPKGGPRADPQEFINRYAFVSDRQIVAITTRGRMYAGTFEEDLRWQEYFFDSRHMRHFASTSVMTRVGDGLAVVGTGSGGVYLGYSPLIELPGKIFDIFCLSKPSDVSRQGDQPFEVLIFLYGKSIGHLLTVTPRDYEAKTYEQIHCLHPQFTPLSAGRVGDLLLVGSRHGYLAVLRKEDGHYRSLEQPLRPTHDAITALVALPAATGADSAAPYVLVTSRDGRYRIYEIDVEGNTARLHLRHEASTPFGHMVEGAYFTDGPAPELVLYGFKSKSFIVWNESRREEVASVVCGGAHRTYSMTPPSTDLGKMRFAFTKTSKLGIFSQPRASHRTVKSGTHGREVRAVSRSGDYIATASEDTSIRIWEYGMDNVASGSRDDMRCVAYIKAHTAGLQVLRWHGSEYLFSSGGNEEFMVWRVRKLQSGYSVLGVICENVFKDKSPIGDLRIMDFDVSDECKAAGDESLIITMAFSNSVLKSYRYTPTAGFVSLAAASYTGACLTQIRHLCVSEHQVSLLTASTDGHLLLWRTHSEEEGTRKYVVESVTRMHQSTIKALDMAMLEDGHCVVVTGGDDNALGVARLKPSAPSIVAHEVVSTAIIRRAHAAAINSLVILQQDRSNGTSLRAASVSNDQRIKLWRIRSSDAGSTGMELLGDAYSGVADPADADLVEGGNLAVAGVGVEVWHLGLP